MRHANRSADDTPDRGLGMSTPPALSYQDILGAETRPVPDFLLQTHPADLGIGPISASRYTSKTFFDREVEKVWYKTWQFACREEDIARAGDTHIYELIDKSALIVRQEDGSIRAFLNVCLHRGRKLMTADACRRSFPCPYHGLTWNIDGSLKENPFAWDFPQVDSSNFGLHPVRCEMWAGFVFVNFDLDAEPLLEQLAPMPEHFAYWRIADCYKAAHVGKVAPANWKACSEAFLEAVHVLATHPQAASYISTETTQYDLLSDHVSRFLSPTGVASALAGTHLDERGRIEVMSKVGSRAGRDLRDEIEEGMTAREYAGNAARRALSDRTGEDFSNVPNADLIDGLAYDFFPGFHLWGGLSQKICYRFRPHGRSHEETLIEVMLFVYAPAGQKPPPAQYRLLRPDEKWESATELNYLAGIYDQDQSNLGPVQEGLRAMGDGGLQFSRYGDMRCRNLHRMIDKYLAR